MPTLFRQGDFLGPNFVNGLSLQTEDLLVISDTEARVKGSFPGGFDTSITYTVTFFGCEFSKTDDGRYTGIVHEMVAKGSDGTSWHVFGYNSPLNNTNTGITEQNFEETLLVPVRWTYVGNGFEDYFIGGSFGDLLIGFGGDDTFQGLGGDDMIFGGGGNDTLNGEADNDTIFGGGQDDTINGGPGSDILFGGLGNDDIFGDQGADRIAGGFGRDYIEGGGQGDTILGELGDDELLGQDGGDRLDGGAGNDRVDGGDGTDIVVGGDGNDVVQGGAGNDFIIGGAGNDLLAGQSIGDINPDLAIDTFIFSGDFGHDIITDFEIDWDSIFLSGISKSLVSVNTILNDVLIRVAAPGPQDDSTILVRGVAQEFDADVDIVYLDSPVDTTIDFGDFDLPDEYVVFSIDTPNAYFASQLYHTAFGRSADEDGLRFWADVLDTLDQQGWTEYQKQQYLAGEFSQSDEFASLYGQNPTNEEYVDAVYFNSLGRLAEDEGRAFWVDGMEQGLSQEDVLIAFAQSDESYQYKMMQFDMI